MDIAPADVVLSAAQTVEYQPPESPRTYILSPMTYRERQAFRTDHARESGVYPDRSQMLAALRQAIRVAKPENADELLATVDAAEADEKGEDTAAQTALSAIEAALASDPGYATLLAARQRCLGMMPWCAARHALRGWSGPGLPMFKRERGAVPAELLDTLPEEEIVAIGTKAMALMRPDKAAEGNSAAPSPSPASQAPTPEG